MNDDFNSKININPGQRQLDLFASLSVDIGPAIKAALAEAIRACPLSHEQLAERINELAAAAGVTCNGRAQVVTADIINKWTSHSAAHHIPLRLLPLFCRAAGSTLPLEVLSEDAMLLEWARMEKK